MTRLMFFAIGSAIALSSATIVLLQYVKMTDGLEAGITALMLVAVLGPALLDFKLEMEE